MKRHLLGLARLSSALLLAAGCSSGGDPAAISKLDDSLADALRAEERRGVPKAAPTVGDATADTEPAPADLAPAEPIYLPTPIVPLRIVSIDLGHELDESNTVTDPGTIFGPKDAIYASIASEGIGTNRVLAARWTYSDRQETVAEHTQTISPTGPARTRFQIEHAQGWPVGRYQLEIRLDGEPVDSRVFDVK